MTSEARLAARVAIQAQLVESTRRSRMKLAAHLLRMQVSFSPPLFGLDRAPPRRLGAPLILQCSATPIIDFNRTLQALRGCRSRLLVSLCAVPRRHARPARLYFALIFTSSAAATRPHRGKRLGPPAPPFGPSEPSSCDSPGVGPAGASPPGRSRKCFWYTYYTIGCDASSPFLRPGCRGPDPLGAPPAGRYSLRRHAGVAER
jgi:hypothetical protein